MSMGRTGEGNGSAKLTRSDVMAIRDKYELRQEVVAEIRQLRADMKALERKCWMLERKIRPLTIPKLAKEYGIAPSTVCDIVYQKTWREVL